MKTELIAENIFYNIKDEKKPNKWDLSLIIPISLLFLSLLFYTFSLIPFCFCCGSSYYWVVGVDNGNIGYIIIVVILFPLIYWIAGIESNTFNHVLLLNGLFILVMLCFVFIYLLLFFVVYECLVVILFFILFVFIPSFYRIRTGFIFYIFSIFGSICFIFSLLLFIMCNWWLCCIFILIPFLVKLPCFPFFYWLPEVHCEANSAISLLLAGLLLKLGVFGILRFILVSFSLSLRFLVSFIFSLALIGVILASCSSFRYFDVKKIIAFSSIIHLNLSFGCILCMNGLSLLCGILTSIAHAFSSVSLFLFAGLIINKSYSRYLDSLVFLCVYSRSFFFLSTLFNASFPSSLNFVGELCCMIGLFCINSLWLVFYLANCFLFTFFWFLVLNIKLCNYYWYFFLNYIEILALLYLLFLNFLNGFYFVLN